MKLTEKDSLIAFAGLTNALIDLIENDVKHSSLFKQNIKFHAKHLLNELLKVTDKIYDGCDDPNVVEQHIEAGEAMLKFFVLGLRMIDMDSTKQQGLNTQINILLKNYEVNLEF